MDVNSIRLQVLANAAANRGDLVEAIQLTKTAQRMLSARGQRDLQDRIDAWVRDLEARPNKSSVKTLKP